MDRPAPRRERLRAATIAEIKRAARDQVTGGGLDAVSLRGVARTIGMTPSALYRYFDSHDVLVDELCGDAFASLADALEAAFEAVRRETSIPARRFLLLVRAYRRWAHAHPAEYTLLFAGPAKHDFEPSARCTGEMRRATGVLFLCMVEVIAAGDLDPAHLDALLTPALKARLEGWGVEEDVPLSAASLAACLIVWTQLQGFIILELRGHLPPSFDAPDDDLFDQQVLATVVGIGYRHPIDLAVVAAPTPAHLLPPAATEP
jgi:AcrR family transcriptional regulator